MLGNVNMCVQPEAWDLGHTSLHYACLKSMFATLTGSAHHNLSRFLLTACCLDADTGGVAKLSWSLAVAMVNGAAVIATLVW